MIQDNITLRLESVPCRDVNIKFTEGIAMVSSVLTVPEVHLSKILSGQIDHKEKLLLPRVKIILPSTEYFKYDEFCTNTVYG